MPLSMFQPTSLFDVTGFRDVVTYGAKGDGVTDDTAAIQAAIDAANTNGGGVVLFTGGSSRTYLSSNLVIKSNVTIRSDGAVLKRKSGTTGAWLNAATAVTDVLFDGMSFDLNATTERWAYFNTPSKRVAFRRCSFSGSGLPASQAAQIRFESGATFHEDLTFEDCRVSGPGGGTYTTANYDTILISSANRVRILHSWFSGCGGVQIVASGSLANGPASVATPGYGYLVDGCTFENIGCSNLLIRPAESSAVMEQIHITNNKFRDCGHVVGKGALSIADSAGRVRQIVIDNNTIRSWGKPASAGTTDNGPAITTGQNCYVTDIQITNNELDQSNLDGTLPAVGLSQGILVRAFTDRFVIRGNTIRYSDSSAIYVQNAANGVIADNVLENCFRVDATTAGVINLYFTSASSSSFGASAMIRNINVHDNTIRNCGLEVSTSGNACGIYVSGGWTENSITYVPQGIDISGNRIFDERDGTHSYVYTYVTSGVESKPSAPSNTITVADNSANGQVSLTGVTVGPAGTTERRIYRTVHGHSGLYRYVGSINDNTTTTFTDNVADSALLWAIPQTGGTAPSTAVTAALAAAGAGNVNDTRARTMKYGVLFADNGISSWADRVQVHNNDFRNLLTSALAWTGSGGHPTNSRFKNNLGHSPVGRLTLPWPSAGVPTIPSSPVSATTYTNITPYDVMVVVSGGTVSQITVGAVSTGVTSGPIRVPAGQTISITWTVQPTWVWFAD